MRFANVESLRALDVDVAHYESFNYTKTQALAAAAHFLEFDGLLVPSARSPCANLVIFLDRAGPLLDLQGTESIDWDVWRTRRARQNPSKTR